MGNGNGTRHRPTRREVLKAAGLAAAGLTAGGPLLAATGGKHARPKNILFLMCDQHRPDALGCYGDPYALTPNLNKLAGFGTSFRRAYCQNPVCVPSRNSILTGRYSHSTGVLTNGHRSHRDLTTFAQVLRSKGYRTGCFGKLHVKGRDDLDWDEYDGKKGHGGDADDPDRLESRFQGGAYRLGAPTSAPISEIVEWKSKEGAIRFLKANRDRPWLVQCSMYKPHPPFQPPQKYWDMIDRSKLKVPDYPADDLDDCRPSLRKAMAARHLDKLTDEQVRDAMQGYYGNLAFADAMLGEVLGALDALGLRDDTLVVYTADHGEMLYAHHLWTKYVFFEESVRIPLILSCPGLVPAKRETAGLVEHVDLFPTFMDILGLETPPSVQGKSFLPLLTGKADTGRNFVFSEHYDRAEKGGKLTALGMCFDGRYKYISNGPETPAELYDLKEDPREITSLINVPEQKDRVEAMSARLRQWAERDVVRPLEPPAGKGEGKKDRGGKAGR